MKVFLKTVLVCLVMCVGYWAYMHFKGASFEPVIITNDTPLTQVREPKEISAEEKSADAENAKPVKVCFMTGDGSVRFVERKTEKRDMKSIVELLLDGPTDYEKQKGLYSEIPQNTKVIWVKEDGGNLIINLTDNFALGGGTTSIMNRIGQLVKTVKMQGTKKPVYLYLGGKKVEYVGGDGVYLQQPLN